jgi:hypothetical protein
MDPEPHDTALSWLSWIRILIRMGNAGPEKGGWKWKKNNK